MKTRLITKIIFVAALAVGVLGSAGAAYAAVTVGTTSVTSNGALTLTGAAASTWSTSAGALTLTAAAASTWSASAGDLTIDANAGSLILDSGEATADAVRITASNAAGGIDVDAGTGGINIATTSTTANAINVIASGTVSGTALNLDTTDGGIELDANGAANGDIIVNAADVLDIDSADALSINSSAGVINVGDDAVAQNINVGTGAAARTIAVGNSTGATAVNVTTGSGGMVVSSSDDNAFTVGANGATNPVLQVDASTASVATGVSVTGAAAGGGVAVGTLSSGTNEALTIQSKGTGTLTIDAGGAGAVTVGSADVTAITLTTDGTGTAEVVLPNESISTAEIANDTITFANISDSSAIDASTTFTAADTIALTLQPTHTSGDTNFLTIDANQTDDGAATDDFDALRLDLTSESGDAGDTFEGIVINWEEGTANTIMDSALKIDNAETTASTLTDAIIVTSSGVADGVVDALDVSAGNITNAVNVGGNTITGTTAVIDFTDFDVSADGLIVVANDADGVALTVSPSIATTTAVDLSDANITNALSIGSNLVLGANGDTLAVGATANELTFNSNTDGTNVVIMGSDGTGATVTVYDTSSTGSIQVGSADVTAVTVTTDGTGTAEVVLPNGAIGEDELAASLAFDDGDVLDLSSVSISTTGEGLILPQHATDCSTAGTTEGQVCWEADADTLYVGDGATVVAISPSTGSTNTWTGTNEFQANVTATMGASELVKIDASSTANTGTAGVLDINVGAGNAAVDAVNVSLTQNTGAAAAVDARAFDVTLTGNDADGDMFGLVITGAATTNATTGTYEAGISIDNAENTANSMTDAIIVTSSGVSGGVVDAIDVSAANITNAINVGANDIVGTTGLINYTNFDVDAAGAVTAVGVNSGTGLIQGTGGLTVTGAAVSLNASSNFAVNIATGTSTGAVSIGGNANTVAIDSSDWDISTTGAMTGIGAVTSDGDITTTGNFVKSVSAGNDPGTGGQGGDAITTDIYEVSASSAGDDVTLPSAAAGLHVTIINSTVNSIDVFPASSDAIDDGAANASEALAGNTQMQCTAFDATTWSCVELAE